MYTLFSLFFGMPKTVAAKDSRAYYVTLLGLEIALLLHVSWLVFFGFWGIEVLFYFNIFSVFAFVTAIALVRLRGMILCGMVIASIETLSHQVVAVYVLGWGYGFEFYVLAVIAYIFYGNFKQILIPILFTLLSLGVFLWMYYVVQHAQSVHVGLPEWIGDIFFVTNVVSIFFIISVFAYIFSSATRKAEALLEGEYAKSERLLLNILPQSIAQRLKNIDALIADSFEEVTVLFTDMVGFTKFSSSRPADEVVTILNTYFQAFDRLAERYGVEKIKTIGDSYMAVAGVPHHKVDHALIMAAMAKEILSESKRISKELGIDMKIRIGMSSGPVTAGVIGNKKFIYDVWGDTVNMASRMESTAQPDSIQISLATHERIKSDYVTIPGGTVEVKGKGETLIYYLN